MYNVLGNNKSNDHKRTNNLSKLITENLKGLDELNRPIIYPDERIYEVLSDIERDYFHNHGEYNQQEIDKMVVKLVCNTIRNEVETIRQNNALDKFDTIFGDFNRHGLSRTSQIKVRNKRPTPMMFHMRY